MTHLLTNLPLPKKSYITLLERRFRPKLREEMLLLREEMLLVRIVLWVQLLMTTTISARKFLMAMMWWVLRWVLVLRYGGNGPTESGDFVLIQIVPFCAFFLVRMKGKCILIPSNLFSSLSNMISFFSFCAHLFLFCLMHSHHGV